MTANDTLASTQDLIDLTPTSQHSYVADRCQFMVSTEEDLFRRCFGWKFYEALLADRYVYSFVAGTGIRTVTHFAVGANYAVGVFVEAEGRIYECIANVTAAKSVNDATKWNRAAKFQTAANQFLWDRYLGRVICFTVMYGSVMYRAVRDTPQGVLRTYDEGTSKPATLPELMALKSESQTDVDTIIKLMDAYLVENKTSFPLYKSGIDDCTDGCGPKKSMKRNLGFNVEKPDSWYVR